MTDSRLPVVLLWHMHQPPYRDALSGRYVLPWTYLHAIKDYTDMAAHLEEVPGAKAVVNFTPVLIEQIEDLTAAVRNCLDHDTPLPDALLATLGPAPLPQEAAPRLALLRACLRADRENLVKRHPTFDDLVQMAKSFDSPEHIGYASDQYLHDLSVWYHLAWMGEAVRREDARVVALVGRARGFDASDRRVLLTLIGELLAGVLPRFRRLAKQGRCELAVSPYSHPILPLLFDFGAARESEPHAPRPHHDAYPGGAARVRWHLDRARSEFERVFGFAPRGCWPSEGAISDAAVKAIEAAGFDWLATSVSVLKPSLAASGIVVPEEDAAADRLLNRGFAQPGGKLECYFRHDGISDLIGFSYSRWHGDDAAANFAQEIASLGVRTAGEPGRVLLVALDGENAWEYYPFNGWYFLRAMYAALASHPDIRLVTLSEIVDEHRQSGIAPAPLRHVRSGSWVYGTLSTWMGDPDKNAGWDLLCEAKRAFDTVVAAGTLDSSARARAEQQLAACEASDWFWWFGDYNPAGAVRDFDELFRHQLASLYRSLGLVPPVALEHRISIGRGVPEAGRRDAPLASGATDRVLARRRSGVLLPASALRHDHRGAFGDPALRFIDWLADAGFTVWQLLPLVPTDASGSPYWARSDRAGGSELTDATAPDPGTEDDFASFRAASSNWLDDFTLFEALSAEQGGAPWWLWPQALRQRDPAALAAARQRLAPQLARLARAQWRFDEQWKALRRRAAARGVKIFGDLPIYVAPDSVATWSSPGVFQLDDKGQAIAVAGVPPDYFSEDGQLWGNPLYDWQAQQRDGFGFWMQRLALQSDRFDLLRIDHFRALEAYWSVPSGATTARSGEWLPAPGAQMLARARQLLPQLELVAEDLGVITPAVNALRQQFGLPGMRVLQFGFDGDPANLHLPHAHSADCVVYTGTHDNDTTAGWYAALDGRSRDQVRRYLARGDHEVHDAMQRAVLGSVGVMAVLPMQDILQLGSEARLNRPGTTTGNWAWRLPAHSLNPDLAARYRDLNQLYDRS